MSCELCDEWKALAKSLKQLVLDLKSQHQFMVNFICELDYRVGITAPQKAIIKKMRKSKQDAIKDGSFYDGPLNALGLPAQPGVITGTLKKPC